MTTNSGKMPTVNVVRIVTTFEDLMVPATKSSDRRTPLEWTFLVLFYPIVLFFYVVYKYPYWLVPEGTDLRLFHVCGKSPGFWYATLYSGLVAGVCLWVLIANQNRYQRSKSKQPLSAYQRGKFLSILLSQSIAFYAVPFILPALSQPGGFFNDPGRLASKSAHLCLSGVSERRVSGVSVPRDPRCGMVFW